MTAHAAVHDGPGGASIAVKVVPGAARDRIAGWLGSELKVQVASPPERGRANERLCTLLARALGVAPRDVQVVRGASAPRKVVAVAGVHAADVAARLEAAIQAERR